MKYTALNGYMCSFIDKKGEEKLVPASFGRSRTRSRTLLKSQNYIRRVEPIVLHKMYEVVILINDEVEKIDPLVKNALARVAPNVSMESLK